jgi:murein DD-endopeptidase MepM/ murein hydrolase activator NlpD
VNSAGIKIQLALSLMLFGVLAYTLGFWRQSPVETMTSFGTISTSANLTSTAIDTQSENTTAEINSSEINPSATLFNYEIKRGDTFAKILKSLGCSPSEALELQKVWSGLGGPLLNVGESLKIRAQDGSLDELHAELKDGDELTISKNNETKALYGMRTPAGVIEEEVTTQGTIDSSFINSAINAGLDYETIDSFVDLFGHSVEFSKDIHPGDTFTITYTARKTLEGKLLPSGDIMSASLMNNGDMLAAIGRKDATGKFHYFSEIGEMLGNYFLRYPLNFSRISSTFTTARFHPVLKISRPHRGVDFAAPIGTPVRSIGDGLVVAAGKMGAAGNVVKINYGGRFTTEYFHLSKISAGIKKGARVSRGQVVGAVGTTGLSTGPHLHFGLFDNGKYVNPLTAKLPAIAPKGVRITKQELQIALSELRAKHEMLKVQVATKNF